MRLETSTDGNQLRIRVIRGEAAEPTPWLMLLAQPVTLVTVEATGGTREGDTTGLWKLRYTRQDGERMVRLVSYMDDRLHSGASWKAKKQK
jgi:hypothetical protein